MKDIVILGTGGCGRELQWLLEDNNLAAPPEEQPAEQPAASAESAASYIGKNVSSLISALGNPLSRTYAPSCLGDGEDGELTYSGFTVYTYREGDSETVQAVE